MGVIKVKNLNFSYDENQKVLHDLSFEVKKGSYTTIVGHNGSGKSTLAKLLVGLLKADDGEILIADRQLNEETIYKIREQIGVVFQNPDNQFIGSTVADDIAFGLENQCIPSDMMQKKIEQFSSLVGMSEYLLSEPTKLSGGQKQRVAIAGVLAMNLNVIILDEATSMLDPKGKEDIKQLINALHKDREMTIISITHDMEEVTNSDYVIVLNEGKILSEGKPETVLFEEETLQTAQLDLPHAIKFQKALVEAGLDVKQQIQLEGVVADLCRLYSKN